METLSVCVKYTRDALKRYDHKSLIEYALRRGARIADIDTISKSDLISRIRQGFTTGCYRCTACGIIVIRYQNGIEQIGPHREMYGTDDDDETCTARRRAHLEHGPCVMTDCKK